MKTKTVRLDEHYQLIDGIVHEVFPTDDLTKNSFIPILSVGDEVVLVRVNGSDNQDSYQIRIAPKGIGGNMDRSIKRFHGWRGTTNDVSVTAIGRRQVKKIRTLKNGIVAVTVGPDLDPTED